MKLFNSVTLLSLLIASQSIHALPANIESKPLKSPIAIHAEKSSKIDLNKADIATLTHSYKGIGVKRAEAIIQYREAHHGFKSIEELAEVKGFGKRFVSNNLDKLKLVFSVG